MAYLTRYVWAELSPEERISLMARPSDSSNAFEVAGRILSEVREEGEAAVRRYAKELDGYAPADFRVPASELMAAANALNPKDTDAILAAADAVRRYHAQQGYKSYSLETWPGGVAERRVTPLEVAGLYVPAGTAPLVSTLLMLAIPAQIAGVSRIAVLTPPMNGAMKGKGPDRTILGAAGLLGLDEVYALGGAHGIAALGFGVAGLPRADRIFGPGNAYVAAAKALLAQTPGGAATDLPAGPSEVIIIADDGADPDFVALDLLAQAEHDRLAQVVLIAFSQRFVDCVERALKARLEALPRRDIAAAALGASKAFLVRDEADAVAAANAYAGEHLIIQTADPEAICAQIRHAGSIFIGPWTPEAAGDYAAGPNHALPTAGAARAYGGVSVEMFQKTASVLRFDARGAAAIAPVVERLAALEGLDAHRLAMAVRREKAEEGRI
ncbi:MAG: histidinol dehydrogenase [Oceanicaulis sp.]|uniref:histidinol dehydrogenase n=1 Tax=Glycocaulis sp. TaxID=1969725 RepID=UPI0025C51684|nr:histidinol dehydrogenase [Glycocaulis sp.]MCC5981518.1 histidinol dehydrogenase [Oceanicaulis sp.]MCH8522878.1 histidinol dehydrogenase [Glycocaulis sp.]